MVQIKILFFILNSFFGMEGGQIMADKTTVTIDPINKKIEIIQDNLFTIIQSEKDTALILAHWDRLLHREEKETTWSKNLDRLTEKSFDLAPVKDVIQPHITLHYLKEIDLRAIGIWYNVEKNQFSINHNPSNNIKTTNGNLIDNYWFFQNDSIFSFTLEPFLDLPEDYQKLKVPLNKLLNERRD